MLKRKNFITKLLILAGITSILTYVAATINTPAVIYNLDGSKATSKEIKASIISSTLLIFPAISFFLGLILALVPFKGWKYVEKIIPAGLIVLIGIESGLLILRFF